MLLFNKSKNRGFKSKDTYVKSDTIERPNMIASDNNTLETYLFFLSHDCNSTNLMITLIVTVALYQILMGSYCSEKGGEIIPKRHDLS